MPDQPEFENPSVEEFTPYPDYLPTQELPLPFRKPKSEPDSSLRPSQSPPDDHQDPTSDDLAPTAPERFVLVIQQNNQTRVLELQQVIYTIGRAAKNSIPIQDRFLSRYHAYLVRVPIPEDDTYTYCVFDGDREGQQLSKNGVFVNDQRIDYSHTLIPGDVISLGPDVRITFCVMTSEYEAEILQSAWDHDESLADTELDQAQSPPGDPQ